MTGVFLYSFLHQIQEVKENKILGCGIKLLSLLIYFKTSASLFCNALSLKLVAIIFPWGSIKTL